jgi:hypothetical protein
VQPRQEARDLKAKSNEKIRIMANWDPSYSNEKVHWYDEYIARNAPISTSWMQQPRNRESAENEYLEARGMAVYKPPGEVDTTLVVAPLDDGSLCLWNINGTRGRKGAIVGRSKPGILSVDKDPQPEDGRRSKMVSTGVTECISIDSAQNKAYIAVQSGKSFLLSVAYFRSSPAPAGGLHVTILSNVPYRLSACSDILYWPPYAPFCISQLIFRRARRG